MLGTGSRPMALLITLAILALAALACAPASQEAPAAPESSRFGDYDGSAEVAYDGSNRYSVYVPMKDGARIAVDYYLPTLEGQEPQEPLPVILHYTRYIRALELEDGSVRGQAHGDPVLQHMLANGYAVAVADARGTGASFGVHNGAFSVEETADSYEIIEWLAAQEWSTGKIGMHGRSYPGMTQYQAATQAPPALKAIFSEMAGPTAYDFLFRGGTYKKDFVETWGATTRKMDEGTHAAPAIAARVDEDEDGSLRAAAIAEHQGNLWAHVLVQDEDSSHRNWSYDDQEGVEWSWEETIATIDDADDIDASGVAVYHLVGWYDIYTTQQPWLYANLETTPQKMMIGPWVHSGGYGGTVHKSEFLRWYDHWLKGIDNGVMNEEPVHYYVMRGNHTLPADATEETLSFDEDRADDGSTWTATASWPPAGTSSQSYFLGGGPSETVESVNDGVLLAAAPAEGGQDDYTVDYSAAMGSFSRWMNGYGSRRAEPAGTTFFDERSSENKKALTYTSAALEGDLTLVGYPVVHLWVSSSHSDGDFFVYLEEIDAEGRSHFVTEGSLRASHRKLDEPPFENFGLPYHRSYPEDLAPLPDEPTELVFDLMGTAIVIDAGHRIRITVTGADRANFATYPDANGEDAPTISIHRGGDRASYIELPVLDGADGSVQHSG